MTLKALIRFNMTPFAEGEKFTERFEMWEILNVIPDLRCPLRFPDTPTPHRLNKLNSFHAAGCGNVEFSPSPSFSDLICCSETGNWARLQARVPFMLILLSGVFDSCAWMIVQAGGTRWRGEDPLRYRGSGKRSVSHKSSQCKSTVIAPTRLTMRWSCTAVNRHDFTFCWVIAPPPAPPPDVSVLVCRENPLIVPSMATLYPAPISSPPESMIQFQNTSILRCLQRLVPVWLSFVSTFSCSENTWIFQNTPLFCPRLLSVRIDSSCRSCTNVLGSVPVMFVIPTVLFF